jgi:hypothetical protein
MKDFEKHKAQLLAYLQRSPAFAEVTVQEHDDMLVVRLTCSVGACVLGSEYFVRRPIIEHHPGSWPELVAINLADSLSTAILESFYD